MSGEVAGAASRWSAACWTPMGSVGSCARRAYAGGSRASSPAASWPRSPGTRPTPTRPSRDVPSTRAKNAARKKWPTERRSRASATFAFRMAPRRSEGHRPCSGLDSWEEVQPPRVLSRYTADVCWAALTGEEDVASILPNTPVKPLAQFYGTLTPMDSHSVNKRVLKSP